MVFPSLSCCGVFVVGIDVFVLILAVIVVCAGGNVQFIFNGSFVPPLKVVWSLYEFYLFSRKNKLNYKGKKKLI